jgi:hypothetical protein
MLISRYSSIDSSTGESNFTLLKAYKKAAQWHHTPFLLYDQIEYLVKSVIATGTEAFHASESPPSSPAPSTLSSTLDIHLHDHDITPHSDDGAAVENTAIGTPVPKTTVGAPAAAAVGSTPGTFILDDNISQKISSSQIQSDFYLCSSVQLIFMSYKTPAPCKHVCGDSESPSGSKSSSKQQACGVWHTQTGDSIAGMLTVIMELASAMKDGPPTPEHHTKAIALVEDDMELSDDEQAKVMVLFAQDCKMHQ